MDEPTAEVNPLIDDSPHGWQHLLDAVGLPSLLVVIESRLGPGLAATLNPEDILQEALLHAWRDRRSFDWRGVKSFRAWLLCIIDNRIRDAADRQAAQKRGGGRLPLPLSGGSSSGSRDSAGDAGVPPPQVSTTPSQMLSMREQAAQMRAALDALPSDLRQVVRFRLFDQLSIPEIAGRLEIGESAVRHRLRRGAEEYQRLLHTLPPPPSTGPLVVMPRGPQQPSA